MLKSCKQALVGAAVSTAAVVALSSAAFAAHTVSPNTNLLDGQQVTVAISGLGAGATAVIAQCNNDQGIAFDPNADCAFLSVVEKIVAADGSGSVTDYVVKKEPDGYSTGDLDWKCDVTGDATGTVTVSSPAGTSRVFSTCRIRVVSGILAGTANESFQNITFAAETQPVIPEAPFAALLPAGAIAALAGGYLIVRNRKTTSVA